MQIGSFDLPCNCSTRLEHGNSDTPLLVFGQKETFVKGLKHPPYNVKPDFLPAFSSLFSTFLFLQKCLKRFSGQLMLGEQLSYLRLVVE